MYTLVRQQKELCLQSIRVHSESVRQIHFSDCIDYHGIFIHDIDDGSQRNRPLPDGKVFLWDTQYEIIYPKNCDRYPYERGKPEMKEVVYRTCKLTNRRKTYIIRKQSARDDGMSNTLNLALGKSHDIWY